MTIKEVNQSMKDNTPVRYDGKIYILCGFQRYIRNDGKMIQSVAIRDRANPNAAYWVTLDSVEPASNSTQNTSTSKQ